MIEKQLLGRVLQKSMRYLLSIRKLIGALLCTIPLSNYVQLQIVTPEYTIGPVDMDTYDSNQMQ